MPGPTEKSGTISSSEKWALEDSPFLITDDLTLGTDVVVDVEAGVEIEIQKKDCVISLGNTGELYLGGTREAPIWIHGQVGIKSYWDKIQVSNLNSSKLRASYTIFEHGDTAVLGNENSVIVLDHCILRENRAGLWFAGAGSTSVYAHHCDFHDNIIGIGYLGGAQKTSDVPETDEYIVENRIHDNEWGIEHGMSGAYSVTLKNNKIYRNRRGGLRLKSAAIGTCTVENNWWGSDSGPEEATGNPTGTGDLILDESSGGVTLDYSPWTTLGRYVPVLDDVREFANRILREGTPSGEEVASIYLEDDALQRIVDRAERRVDRWLSKGPPLENRLLGYGTETNEMHDVKTDGKYIETRYHPIVSVTLVEVRSGANSWASVQNQENGGWYASEEDMRRGRIWIDNVPNYEKDSFRVSYSHGHYDAPEEIREAVIKLAALEVFHAILQSGEDDPYATRAQALKQEIDALRNELLERKPRYVVI